MGRPEAEQTRGKRGCALALAFTLHVGGLGALLLGCLTPYWSTVEDAASGEVTLHEGLLVSLPEGGDWELRDFNSFAAADSDKTILYLTLSVSFALLTVFFELFLLQALAFALYNASCGRRYNPDWFIVCSLLAGLLATTSLVLYEVYTGRSFNDSTNVSKMDFSRGFVIIFIAAALLSAFFTVCDRTGKSPK